MPPRARHYLASALRFGRGAEDLLHLLRLEQAVDALPRFPWETAERLCRPLAGNRVDPTTQG
ncbi:hypothetical protein AB1A84_14500, partial [Stenotrophomonas maltophilia]